MFHRPASRSKVNRHWQCECATNRARPAWGLCCWQARLRSHTCQHSRPHPPATAASKPPWDTAIRQAHVVRWAERIGRDKQTNQPLLAVLPRGVREYTGGGVNKGAYADVCHASGRCGESALVIRQLPHACDCRYYKGCAHSTRYRPNLRTYARTSIAHDGSIAAHCPAMRRTAQGGRQVQHSVQY